MFDYQNSEDLQELREYIENIEAEKQEMRKALEKITKEAVWALEIYADFKNGNRASHYTKIIQNIADKVLNKTSL